MKETSRNSTSPLGGGQDWSVPSAPPGEGRPADLPSGLFSTEGSVLQHLLDAVGAGLGPGELEQGHGHHHHAHEDLHDVVDEGLEVAQFKGGPP